MSAPLRELIDDDDAQHAVFDSVAWQQVAAMSHKRARPLTAAEQRRASTIPEFDDPDFMAKLHTDAAPMNDRVRLFVRLWQSFDPALRAEFLREIGVRRTG